MKKDTGPWCSGNFEVQMDFFFYYSAHRETAIHAGTEVLQGHGIVPFVPFFSEAEP